MTGGIDGKHMANIFSNLISLVNVLFPNVSNFRPSTAGLKSSQLFSNSTRKAKALKTTISYKFREFENTSSTGLLGIAYIYNIYNTIWIHLVQPNPMDKTVLVPKVCHDEGSWADAAAPRCVATTPNCPSRGEIPKILKLAWGKAFVEVVAMRRLACV
jgi:hypothetical protein